MIATNVGGVADLIKDKETGLLINPASAEEIYKALVVLLEDEQLRKRLGQNAKIFVRNNYSIDRMVDGYRRVYEEVIGLARYHVDVFAC